MLALTGIERGNPRFIPVQLVPTGAFYVELVPRRPGNMPHGRVASSLGRHLKADSSLNFCLPRGGFCNGPEMEVAPAHCQGGR